MKRMHALFLLGLLVSLSACIGGSNEPEPVGLGNRYLLERDFMWEQMLLETKEHWKVESDDPVTGTITTDWKVEPHPFNTFGRRTRLVLTLEGDESEGFEVKAAEEVEKNTNQEDPLSMTEADWEPMDSDNAEAERFLYKLHRRINPRATWKEELER